MHPTKIDLSSNLRGAIIDELQAALADSIDLKTQMKQAHWNVKGPSFIALHELFDTLSTAADDYTDLIAERIVTLGGTAIGTLPESAKRSRLPAYPLDIKTGADHVDAVSTALAAYGKLVRRAIDTTADLKDADTADIFTEVSRGVDKHLWFVEAHHQAKS
ncbi:MAG TPA: DNA starvation/stationary phase protection protein Dps [Stellaceae bacterium]|nr:DNA starvation/stationary phase protection protein Dps [Stellaceae bacterium]